MPLISGSPDATTEMESSVEECERLSLRLLVGIVLAHEQFDLLREQSTDRGVALGRENLGASQRSSVQPDGDVLTGCVG
jgi:hypothetical protein